jgi:hypothetical protein
MVDVDSLRLKQSIRFKLLTPHDTVYHTGVITGLLDYETAKQFSDIDVTYNELLKAGKPVVSAAADTYFKLNYTDENNVVQTTCFGKTWIDVSTLSIIESNTYHDIRIYDVSEDEVNAILQSIKAMHYTAEILAK